VVWCGEGTGTEEAAAGFFDVLRRVVSRRAYHVDAGVALGKITFAYRAVIDAPVEGFRTLGNEVTVLPVRSLDGLGRDHCGAGLFFEYRADHLGAIVPFVRRKDQTLTHFGFAPEELRNLARDLGGRGVDRMVPVGQALAFDRYWDGMDLLAEMARRVVVRTSTSGVSQP
jgi:hypothetical protein